MQRYAIQSCLSIESIAFIRGRNFAFFLRVNFTSQGGSRTSMQDHCKLFLELYCSNHAGDSHSSRRGRAATAAASSSGLAGLVWCVAGYLIVGERPRADSRPTGSERIGTWFVTQSVGIVASKAPS